MRTEFVPRKVPWRGGASAKEFVTYRYTSYVSMMTSDENMSEHVGRERNSPMVSHFDTRGVI